MRDLDKERKGKNMSGVPQIKIKESVEELKELMKKQKTGIGFAKVQTLYLFKIKAVETVRHLAVLVGRGESTIHRWLKVYRERGIKSLLKEEEAEETSSGQSGRTEIINVETAAAIQQELKEEEGFSSDREVQQWLEIVKGIKIHYISVWRICRYEFQAKLKIPRPQSNKQAQGELNKFKLEFSDKLMELVLRIKSKMGKTQNIRYWCGDETRLGLQTIGGKKLTLKGVKPCGEKQWKFDYYYLYGLVEPKTGETF
ncbi:hypothetical protein CFPU101_29130 [Chroococcus sp. FPU101]|nr:hypothetical protein CFPU101_29130 [Chroococcus sp. FPU101]